MPTHRLIALASLALLAGFTGCVPSSGTSVRMGSHDLRMAPGSPDASKAGMEKLATLAGEWEMTDDKGVRHTALIYSVSSGGTAVREIMFPGHPHEMTNMYHADGGSIVVTHFCAMGNQPRMRCTSSGPADGAQWVWNFEFDGVTNLRAKDETYMGGLKLTLVDANTLNQNWTNFQSGQAKGEKTILTLKRKGA